MDMPDVGVAVSTGAVGTLVGAIVAWWKAKQPRKIEPSPLPVEKLDKFVTRGEFNKHVEDNARDHESLFGRMNRNDRETSELKGILSGIREDLSAIKDKMFRRK